MIVIHLYSRVCTIIISTRVKYNAGYFNPGYICVASTHDSFRHCETVAHRRGIGITDVFSKEGRGATCIVPE